MLGEKGAADLHRRMTLQIMEEANNLKKTRQVSLEILYHGGTESLMRRWLGPNYSYKVQEGGDLGDRMFYAFEEELRICAQRVVLIGTDIPRLSASVLERAFQELLSHDLVLGPAADGGYYLIGLNRRPHRALFTGIPWGSREVLKSTLNIAKKLGLSVALLETLRDVDEPKDLKALSEA